MAKKIKTIIEEIELSLSEYYGFSLNHRIIDFVLNRKSMEALNTELTSPMENRASLYLTKEEGELFIGFYICETLVSKLIEENPFLSLHNKNIDAFCALIEEISHFHLIMNRVDSNRTTSHLELEWQGEIDKFLISNLLLEKQSGTNHLIPIAQILFDIAIIEGENKKLYEKANKFAAKFCYDISNNFSHVSNFLNSNEFRNHMIQNYHAPMNDKKMFSNRERKLTAA